MLEADPNTVKKEQELYNQKQRLSRKMLNKHKQEHKDVLKTSRKSITEKPSGNEGNATEMIDKLKQYDLTLPDQEMSSSFSSICSEEIEAVTRNNCTPAAPNASKEERLGDFDINAEVNHFRNNYNFTDSSATTDIDNIQSILVGGTSSRFWLFRKHMICIDYDFLKNDSNTKSKSKRTNFSFYAWQCITIVLPNRNIDIVIKNEENMIFFLRFLIMSLNTFDGIKNSAEKKI